jgi:large subunit ribosomal protein L20
MRATNGPATRQRRNRVLKRAKGFVGGRHRLYRTAVETVLRARVYSTIHRKRKKANFRRLWITRLSAAVELCGMKYSRFVHGLKKAGIELNRKELSELAIHDWKLFEEIAGKAQAALAS